MLSLCYQAGFDTVSTAEALGIACGVGIMAVALLLLRFQRSPQPASALALAATATAPALGVYAVSGMETLLYSFLWLLFLYLFLLEDRGALRFPLSGLVGALICLTRPEGFIVLAVFAALRLAKCRWMAGNRRMGVIWVIEVLVVVLPFLCWRYWHYGHLLPMPVYAKATSPHLYRGFRQLLGGARYIFGFAKTYGGGLAMALLVVFSFRQLLKDRLAGVLAAISPAALLSLFFLWYLLYVLNVGGDWMPQFRFLVPLLPAMFVLAANPDFLALFPRNYAAAVPGALLLFNLLQIPLVLNPWGLQDVEPYLRYGGISAEPSLAAHYRQLGARFEGQTLATTECGMLPYYSGLKTIDMMGLNDEVIGMTFHRNKGLLEVKGSLYDEVLAHVFAARPEVVHVGGGLLNNEVYYQKLMAAEEFRSRYALDEGLSVGGNRFFLLQVPR
jgi:hypothetical protein